MWKQGHLGYRVFNCPDSATPEGTLEGSGAVPALARLFCLPHTKCKLPRFAETIANTWLKESSSYTHWYWSWSPWSQVTCGVVPILPFGIIGMSLHLSGQCMLKKLYLFVWYLHKHFQLVSMILIVCKTNHWLHKLLGRYYCRNLNAVVLIRLSFLWQVSVFLVTL